ncbi:D-arabinono-1,4-lactone oxidase [Protaetiibacter intestinalis]|uniref:FAD-binding protein n=1 Tax=Protaetiibacter intestinalis TaxID=2419774 RepID=A0A387B9D6_9MICO|nr:D-arabinono-1,4-lactone oxidase [Protaetiibacter intestinalis]AYF98997.1 FAD-binding protein [Protaetiibacter intestinalis]
MGERNWAGNIEFGGTVASPASVTDVQRLVADAGPGSLRPLGTRHSFSPIADTRGALVSSAGFADAAQVRIADDRRSVSVPAGIRYGELARLLEAEGLALANLASLPHISVAGAVATGTHGSGVANGSLATSVRELEFVDGEGALVTLRRGDADFAGAVVALGVLGFVTRIVLDVEPSFTVAQTVYRHLPVDEVLSGFDKLVALGYSVSLFTSWADPDVIDQLWLKRRLDRDAPAPDEVLGALPSPVAMHPIADVDPVHCTPQLGRPGPWLDRLPHFRLEFTPSNGAELQSEYLVPRAAARDALYAVRGMSAEIVPLLQITEIREIAADELWLSSAFGTDAVGLHFTWKPEQTAVDALLPRLEERLLPLGARPHWGKRFHADADTLAPLYPRFDDFRALAARHDPRGLFVNDFLRDKLAL